MEVALLYSCDCVYSQITEQKIRKYFESPDSQNLDLNEDFSGKRYKSYDLSDMRHYKSGTEFYQSQIQVILISHHFLESLKKEIDKKKKEIPLWKILRKKRIIAILLNVTLEDLLPDFSQSLGKVDEWFTIQQNIGFKLDHEFYQKIRNQIKHVNSTRKNLGGSASFSIFPKIICKEQSNVHLIFKKDALREVGQIDENEIIKVQMRHQGNDLDLDIQILNPYMVHIHIPDAVAPIKNESTLIKLIIFQNGTKIGTELCLYENHTNSVKNDRLLEKLFKSIPGFTKLFDEHISHKLSMLYNECSNYATHDQSLEILNTTIISQSNEFPTMMHYATYHGLELVVWVLLENTDGLEQCNCRNEFGKTPLDLAEDQGHLNLSQTIQSYKEVMDSMKACTKYTMTIYQGLTHEINKRVSNESSNTNYKVLESFEEIDQILSQTSRNLLKVPEIDTETESSEGQPEAEVENPEITIIEPNNQEILMDKSEESEICDSIESLNKIPIPMNRRESRINRNHQYVNLYEKSKRWSIHGGVGLYANILPEVEINEVGVEKIVQDSFNLYDQPPIGIPRPYIPPELPLKPSNLASKMNNLTIGKPPVINYTQMVPKNSNDSEEIIISSNIINSGIGDFSTDSDSDSIYDNVFNDKPTLPLHGGNDSKNPYVEMDSLKNVQSKLSPRLRNIRPSLDTKDKFNFSGPNDQKLLDHTDEELLEIINDFKNKIYSINQVELIFGHWLTRDDVKLTIQEKEKHLKIMQKEYRKVQQALNRTTKTSIFSKIIPFGKKKQSLPNILPSRTTPGEKSSSGSLNNYLHHKRRSHKSLKRAQTQPKVQKSDDLSSTINEKNMTSIRQEMNTASGTGTGIETLSSKSVNSTGEIEDFKPSKISEKSIKVEKMGEEVDPFLNPSQNQNQQSPLSLNMLNIVDDICNKYANVYLLDESAGDEAKPILFENSNSNGDVSSEIDSNPDLNSNSMLVVLSGSQNQNQNHEEKAQIPNNPSSVPPPPRPVKISSHDGKSESQMQMSIPFRSPPPLPPKKSAPIKKDSIFNHVEYKDKGTVHNVRTVRKSPSKNGSFESNSGGNGNGNKVNYVNEMKK